jgi:hypothetical protein
MCKFIIALSIMLGIALKSIGVESRHRIIVLSDISGTAEPDDTQSFIRFLLYSNEFDVEGIVGTGSRYGPSRGDIAYFERLIDAYGQVRNNLQLHSSGYPTVEQLKSVLRHGQRGIVGMEGVGNGKNTAGSDLIIDALLREDTRPLWITIWGATGTLAQALWDIKYNKGLDDPEIHLLVSKIRVYDIAGQDNAGGWIAKTFPDIFYIRSSVQFLGFAQGHVPRSQGGDLSVADDDWFNANIMGHEPLGSLYPRRKAMYEGDTPSFLFLYQNGLSDPGKVNYGGWGGRFNKDKVLNANEFSHTKVDESAYYNFFIYNDAADQWSFDGAQYNNVYCPLFRWREEYQNDFAARIRWTTLPYSEANHNPVLVVDGDSSRNILYRRVNPGSSYYFDAKGSSDPDGDSISFEWFYYKEPGSYKGNISVTDSSSQRVMINIPNDAAGTEIHIILKARDNGTPNLFSYRRIVCSVGISKTAPESVAFPIKISKNKRYFTDSNNRPFFYQACTGWELLSKLTREETEMYLKNRAEKGFNTIQVTLLPWEVDKVNRYGEPAFIDKIPFGQPNEKYFEHVDWVLHLAQELGIQFGINVFWLRNNWREYTTVENAKTFGEYIAKRFLKHDNIMWFTGGDINPMEHIESQKALSETIHRFDNKHLLSYHGGRYSDGSSTSSSALFHREPWHDYNMGYCYDPSHCPRIDPYAPVQFIHAWNLKPVQPVILGESFYEDLANYTFKNNNEQLHAVRRNPLWAISCGAMGHAVGHSRIYPFKEGWQKALDEPNSIMVKNLTQLMSEIQWWTLVPDQYHEVAINGFGNFGGEHYISMAYCPEGKLALAYFPDKGKLTVDMSKFSGKTNARWIDPASGTEVPVTNDLPTKGTFIFSTPGVKADGYNDYLLVIELI